MQRFFNRRAILNSLKMYFAYSTSRIQRMTPLVRSILFASRRAIARVQTIVVVLLIVIVCVGGLWYYTQSTLNTNLSPFILKVISRPTVPMGSDESVMSIVGQRVVFLVTVEDTGKGNGSGRAVEISATAPDAEVYISNPAIEPGEIAEITVIPAQTSTKKC